ncbi:GP179 protein, partial [Podargus strigoides]|nr:GP179 protein [Podargus strigoides]
PGDHAEVEQPHAKPVTGSPHPPTGVVQGAAAGTPRTEVCPRGAPSIPAGKAALLRQEAIASQEDSGVPRGEESLAKALEEGSSQPEPLGPGGSLGAERVPPRSWGTEVSPAAAGREAEICAGGTPADSSIKIEICPWEESEGERWGPGRAPGKKGGSEGPGRAPGKGGSERDALSPGEEVGMEKPPAKHPELGKAGRRAEVCPWESGEGEKSRRAEICPWDTVAADKGSSQRGAPHPGEGREQPSTGLTAQHPALPQAPPKQGGTIESKRANICPWEVEDELLPKREICPWEEAAAPSGKEKPSKDTRGTSKGEDKPGSGGFEDPKAKLAERRGARNFVK